MKEKKLNSLPLKDIKISDDFWSKYVDLVRDTIIPYQWEILNDRVEVPELSHCISNFKIAAGLSEGEFKGAVFQDTDLAKWLEAVAYSLACYPDKRLEELADSAIELIGKAQGEDGYINTYFTIVAPQDRWTNLKEGHELYTAGHFIEAAVAYYQSTGKETFLKIMRKFADYICTVFGDEDGKISGYPGHPEIELALFRLYKVTGEVKYRDLAKYFIDTRGQEPKYFNVESEKNDGKLIFEVTKHFDESYYLSHLPISEQHTAEGHAVRAVYLYSAMAELAYEYQDTELMQTCIDIMQNIVNKRMYITGSIGSAALGERFTCDYDLPNHSNYSETCATVGLAMFALRMLQIHHDGKYGDIVERALYNTLLSGISLDGKQFFYVNPLEVIPEVTEKNTDLKHVKTERQKWFGVACCPPNIARTLASLGQYIYSASEDEIYINLYISNKTSLTLGNYNLDLTIKTQYPFDSAVSIGLKTDEEVSFTVALRVPMWSRVKELRVNGETIEFVQEKGFINISRKWTGENYIDLQLDMPAMLVCANPKVRADIGKVAVVKGPVVYCMEQCDNGENLGAIEISPGATLTEKFEPDILGGTLTVEIEGSRIIDNNFGEELYRPFNIERESCSIKLIPYCLWNNRGKGEMLVWIRTKM